MAKNVDIQVDKKKQVMTITVNLKKTFGESKSGKTIIIATSEGNKKVETPKGDIFVGLNVFEYPKDEDGEKPSKRNKRSKDEDDDEDEEDEE